MIMQAMTKLKEPKVLLKVRKSDLSVLKENLESIKSKFSKVRSALPSAIHPPMSDNYRSVTCRGASDRLDSGRSAGGRWRGASAGGGREELSAYRAEEC